MRLHKSFVAAFSFLLLVACGCHSGPKGTYADANGNIKLDFKGDGKASLTFLGKTTDCTYTSGSPHVTVKCREDADPMVFTVQKDGSLTGPPSGFLPALRKMK